MSPRGAILLLVLASLCAPTGATRAEEPKNLSLLKDEIGEYVDSGRYLAEITAVAKSAMAWIEERATSHDPQSAARLTVVFDIDETMLSNLPHMRSLDFGYQSAAWHAWVERGEAPVIEPVRGIYRRARQLGIEIVFLTGRRERDRPGTEKNLRAVELGEYSLLILKPDAAKETSRDFKVATRRRLIAEGRVIIANIGDQESDLAGGFAERTFKVPCPFYLSR